MKMFSRAVLLLALSLLPVRALAATTGRVYLVLKNSGAGSFSTLDQVRVYANSDYDTYDKSASAPSFGTAGPGATFLAEFSGLYVYSTFQGTYQFEVSFWDTDAGTPKKYLFGLGTRFPGTGTYYVSKLGVTPPSQAPRMPSRTWMGRARAMPATRTMMGMACRMARTTVPRPPTRTSRTSTVMGAETCATRTATVMAWRTARTAARPPRPGRRTASGTAARIPPATSPPTWARCPPGSWPSPLQRASSPGRGQRDGLGLKHGWVCGTPRSVETPGLMNGLAGIGYGVLRLYEPAGTPSVLLLDPPRSKAS